MRTEWQWGCLHCLMTGPADNADMAAAFIRFHERYFCPGTAVSYDDPEDGYLVRVARHRNLSRLYPDEVPEWTGKWEETQKQAPTARRAAE